VGEATIVDNGKGLWKWCGYYVMNWVGNKPYLPLGNLSWLTLSFYYHHNFIGDCGRHNRL